MAPVSTGAFSLLIYKTPPQALQIYIITPLSDKKYSSFLKKLKKNIEVRR
jgi:hypothetical protein